MISAGVVHFLGPSRAKGSKALLPNRSSRLIRRQPLRSAAAEDCSALPLSLSRLRSRCSTDGRAEVLPVSRLERGGDVSKMALEDPEWTFGVPPARASDSSRCSREEAVRLDVLLSTSVGGTLSTASPDPPVEIAGARNDKERRFRLEPGERSPSTEVVSFLDERLERDRALNVWRGSRRRSDVEESSDRLRWPLTICPASCANGALISRDCFSPDTDLKTGRWANLPGSIPSGLLPKATELASLPRLSLSLLTERLKGLCTRT